MSRFSRAWQRFWLAEGSTFSLDLFRILFAAALLLEVHTSQVKSINAVDDGLFHLAYLDLLPTVGEPTYHLLHALQSPLILLLGLGLAPRLSCATLLTIQGWLFFADRLNFRNHPYLFLLLLLLLMLAPIGESLSLPALIRALGRRAHTLFGARRPLTWQRLIQVQICLTYGFAALHKLHPAFLRGDVLREVCPAAVEWPSSLLSAMAWLTLTLELLLPLALWHRRTRLAAVLLGLPFHLAIAAILEIQVFSLVMIASYVLFFDAERPASRLRDLASRLWNAPSYRGAP